MTISQIKIGDLTIWNEKFVQIVFEQTPDANKVFCVGPASSHSYRINGLKKCTIQDAILNQMSNWAFSFEHAKRNLMDCLRLTISMCHDESQKAMFQNILLDITRFERKDLKHKPLENMDVLVISGELPF